MFTWPRQFYQLNLLPQCEWVIRAGLLQASASTLLQLCDDTTNSVLIEINGDAWKCVAIPFWSIIAELMLGVTEQGRSIVFYFERCRCDNRRCIADAWCKRTLTVPGSGWCAAHGPLVFHHTGAQPGERRVRPEHDVVQQCAEDRSDSRPEPVDLPQ